MAWNNIIGQERVKTLLQRAILDKKIAHAYCLIGFEGVGKDALAIEFAKTVNCKNPVITINGIDACNECSSCRQAKILQHPNIQLVFALPTGKKSDTKKDSPLESLSDEQSQNINEQVKLKAENPYHKIAIPDANLLKIASIREIKRNLVLSATQQGRRCIIISRGDEMTPEAANAFLKTLEEPHDFVTIIITTSRQEAILPTILSRCQQIKCEPLSDELISEAVRKNMNVTLPEARLVAAFAQGSYTRALDFLDENMKTAREVIINILRASLKKKNFRSELITLIESISSKKDRRNVEILLGILLLWFRDVITYIEYKNSDRIINIDQVEAIKRFAENFMDKNIMTLMKEVETAINRIRKNVNIQLVLIKLFLSIKEEIIGVN
ncbi:MAG: DNA polymerase III subunit delta' C-terminal domain-containing protein [FCB group bacterium]